MRSKALNCLSQRDALLDQRLSRPSSMEFPPPFTKRTLLSTSSVPQISSINLCKSIERLEEMIRRPHLIDSSIPRRDLHLSGRLYLKTGDEGVNLFYTYVNTVVDNKLAASEGESFALETVKQYVSEICAMTSANQLEPGFLASITLLRPHPPAP